MGVQLISEGKKMYKNGKKKKGHDFKQVSDSEKKSLVRPIWLTILLPDFILIY